MTLLPAQVIAFEVLQKFPAISREKYAMFLALEADGSLDHPQLIAGDTAQLCIQQFQQAHAPASSPGDPWTKPCINLSQQLHDTATPSVIKSHACTLR
jgi:hypothetical protein